MNADLLMLQLAEKERQGGVRKLQQRMRTFTTETKAIIVRPEWKKVPEIGMI
jgi:hypothetical protein